MNIRYADKNDIKTILKTDKHISPEELSSNICLKRVYVLEQENNILGYLRYNLFWDNTPFINMLHVVEPCRKKGYGKTLIINFENEMKEKGHKRVMTSTLSYENAQHLYRKLDYVDSGCLLLPGEALEIIFTKELY